jgi:cobalt transporter subunit CbtB
MTITPTTLDAAVGRPAVASSSSGTLLAAMVALVLGLALVYTTGFAAPSALHNAAHDTRHALSYPCH